MASDVHHITEAALALDPSDRLLLASELVESVEGAVDAGWQDAWTAEIHARSSAVDEREARGEDRGASWADVRQRRLLRLAARDGVR